MSDPMERWYDDAERPGWMLSLVMHISEHVSASALCVGMILTGILLQALATLHWWEGTLGPLGGLCGLLSVIPIASKLGWWKSIAFAVGAWLFVAAVSAFFALVLVFFIGTGK